MHNGLGNRQHQGVAHCAHVGCRVLSQLPEELILSLQPTQKSLPKMPPLPFSVHSRRELPGRHGIGRPALPFASRGSH